MKHLPLRVQVGIVLVLTALWFAQLIAFFLGWRLYLHPYFSPDIKLGFDSLAFIWFFIVPIFLAYLAAKMFDGLAVDLKKNRFYISASALGFLPLLLEIGTFLFGGGITIWSVLHSKH